MIAQQLTPRKIHVLAANCACALSKSEESLKIFAGPEAGGDSPLERVSRDAGSVECGS